MGRIENNSTQKRVLIVDDNRPLVQLITFMLEESGYRVQGAINGQDALQRIAEEVPDLVLLDFFMPGMNGIEVCQLIRRHHEKRPYIIMHTADDCEETRQASLAAGADDLISKETPVGQLTRQLLAFLAPAYN